MRAYTTRRLGITNALAEKLKDINGQGAFLTDLSGNVSPRLKFWDEVEEFPTVHLNAGAETREYQGGGYKDRFLSVTVRCYVREEDADYLKNYLIKHVNKEEFIFSYEWTKNDICLWDNLSILHMASEIKNCKRVMYRITIK